MIPKTIHYCWFGRKPLPEDALKCISSWEKYFPDYTIKRWDESNFDLDSCTYAREAYDSKKWAFVSDYARFKILFENGGVYFDTDVEVIKSFDDIIACGPFMGCEKNSRFKKILVNPGLGLAAPKDSKLVEQILQEYYRAHFINEDGTYNEQTVVTRVSSILEEYGFSGSGSVENIAGFNIYPSDYFCPIDVATDEMKLTKNTRSIHHYNASWVDKNTRKKWKIYKRLNRLFGRNAADNAVKVFHMLKK